MGRSPVGRGRGIGWTASVRVRPRPAARATCGGHSPGCAGARRTARPASRPAPHRTGELRQQDLARRAARRAAVTLSASIALSPRTAPVIRTTWLNGRVASRTAFAVPASSVPNAIAVGPDEQRPERLADRILGGDPHQPVLDDAVRHVLLAQGAPDLGDLLHREAAVLGDDQRPGVRELLAQFGDGLPLGLCRHVASCPSARGRRAAVGRPASAGAPATSWPPPEGGDPGCRGAPTRRWRHRSCLGVLAVVPGRAPWAVTGPVRRIKPRPSPPRSGAAVRGRRLSAAVRLFDCRMTRLSAVIARCRRRRRAPGQAAAAARTAGMSTRMPGPIVLAMVRVLRYWPFAPAGFARFTASTSAARLATSCSASKLPLPTGDVDHPGLVDLELDPAALDLADGAVEVERDRARPSGSASGRGGRGSCRAGRPGPSSRASRGRRRTRASRLRSS